VPDLSAIHGEPASKRRRLDEDDDEEGDMELDIPMGSSSTPIKEGARYLQSLTVLTKRFLELIRKSKRGEVDLKTVAESLNVQKRRLYDITNVLEGIGLVEKKPKGFIKWCAPDTVDPLKVQQVETQHQIINELIQEELLLDNYIEVTSKGLNDLTTSKSSDNTMFVSHQDILALPTSQGQTIFALKAPAGTTMDVVDPESDPEERKYEIHLKSDGRIDVYLLNNPDGEDAGDKGTNCETVATLLLTTILHIHACLIFYSFSLYDYPSHSLTPHRYVSLSQLLPVVVQPRRRSRLIRRGRMAPSLK
jgi:hypothetical protein